MENTNIDFTIEEQHYAKDIHNMAVEILEQHCLCNAEFMSLSIGYLEKMRILAINTYQKSGLPLFKRIAEKAEYCKQEYIENQDKKLDLMNTDFMSHAITLMDETLNRTANVYKDYSNIGNQNTDEAVEYVLGSDYGRKPRCGALFFDGLDARRIEALIDLELEYLFPIPRYGKVGVMEVYHFIRKYPGFIAKGNYYKEGHPNAGIRIWVLYYDSFALEVDNSIRDQMIGDFLTLNKGANSRIIDGNYIRAEWE